MRKLRRGAAVVLIAALAISGLACASAERNAYRTIGSLSIGVDFAMNAWGEWVRGHAGLPGEVPAADENKVREAYSQYQQGMATLKTAVLTYKAAKAAGGVLDAGVLEAAIAGATDFAMKLVALINSFRTSEKPLTLTDFGPVVWEAETLLYGGR
jgi:hypothetical protein